MSRVLAGGPGLGDSRVILRLLAAVREVRTVADTGGVQPSARVSFIAPDRNHDVDMLDAVAGCEFVDDRIHLLE
jgi:hypothetical protein